MEIPGRSKEYRQASSRTPHFQSGLQCRVHELAMELERRFQVRAFPSFEDFKAFCKRTRCQADILMQCDGSLAMKQRRLRLISVHDVS